MPIYEYECRECQNVVEQWQSISDDPLSTCPECSGEMSKLISSSSFQLKGGGWYADGYSGSSSAEKSSSSSSSDSPKSTSCPAASGGG